jgi:hypothetical protein
MGVVVWTLPRIDCLFWFFRCPCTGAAGECIESCCGATGCTGAAEQKVAGVDEGYVTATVACRNRIHAGNDHASFASGGDDGADCVTHGK